VEEGSGTASPGRYSAPSTAIVWFLHTLRRRDVSLLERPTRPNLTCKPRYLVNAKPGRGTLRDVLRSRAQFDPVKIVRRLLLAGQAVCLHIHRSKGSRRLFSWFIPCNPPSSTGTSIVYVTCSSDDLGAYGYNLKTSIVVDENWNPLLQDFRLSKVITTHGIKTKRH